MSRSTLARATLRWGLRVLLVVVVLFTVVTAIHYGLYRSAVSRWSQLESRLRSSRLLLTPDDAAVAQQEDHQLGRVRLATRRASVAMCHGNELDHQGVVGFDYDCGLAADVDSLSPCIEPTRRMLNQNRLALEEWTELQSDAELSSEALDGVEEFGRRFGMVDGGLDRTSLRRDLARLLTAKLVLELIDENYEEAVRSLDGLLLFTEPLFYDGTLISPILAVASDSQTLSLLQSLLGRTEVPQADLDRLRSSLDRHRAKWTMKWTLEGEMAAFARTLDPADMRKSIEAYKTYFPNIAPRSRRFHPNNWFLFRADWQVAESRIRGVEVFERLLSKPDDPRDILTTANQEFQLLQSSPTGAEMIQILMPSFIHSLELLQKSRAQIECARLALAAEEYRVQTGRFPGQWSEIAWTNAILLPIDPYDGRPIRMKRTEKGAVFYSIGENQIDDDGQIVPSLGKYRPLDVGIELVSPSLRGNR